MGTTIRTRRRRAIVVALCAASVTANAAIGGAAVHRLPYLLGGLTVVFLLQTFWEEERVTAGGWLSVGAATLLAALVISITFSVNRTGSAEATQVADAPATTALPSGPTSTTLLSGTDVPAEVAGAVESREDAERLVTCESALEQIAAAIRQSGRDIDPRLDPSTATAEPDSVETQRRLESCDVRLRAIAATLPG